MNPKTIVITGASRGLGLGMAETFLADGMRLGLCARSGSDLAEKENVLFSALDVRNEDAVFKFAKAVEDRFGAIDLWINNAGVLNPVKFVKEVESQAFVDHLAINVVGVFHGSKAYLQHRQRYGGGGVLINISSGAALKPYAAWGPYCAGKAAVDRLTECIQVEEEASGLRAYAVAPGVIDTDMQSTIRGLTESQFPMVEKFHQLKRDEAFNTPAFVAREIYEVAFTETQRPENVVIRLKNE